MPLIFILVFLTSFLAHGQVYPYPKEPDVPGLFVDRDGLPASFITAITPSDHVTIQGTAFYTTAGKDYEVPVNLSISDPKKIELLAMLLEGEVHWAYVYPTTVKYASRGDGTVTFLKGGTVTGTMEYFGDSLLRVPGSDTIFAPLPDSQTFVQMLVKIKLLDLPNTEESTVYTYSPKITNAPELIRALKTWVKPPTPWDKANVFSAESLDVLKTPTNATLYSIDPNVRPKDGDALYCRYLVLGKAALTPGDARLVAAACIKAADDYGTKLTAIGLCFDPRAGLHIAKNGHHYEFLICYQCGAIEVIKDGKNFDTVQIKGTRSYLNTILDKYHLPIAEPTLEADDAAAAKANAAQVANWKAAMPSSLLPFWGKMYDDSITEQDDNSLRSDCLAALRKQYPDTTQQIVALFGWYGSDPATSGGYPAYEELPYTLLVGYPTKDLEKAALSKLNSTEAAGAVRLFLGNYFASDRVDHSYVIPLPLYDMLTKSCLASLDPQIVKIGHNMIAGRSRYVSQLGARK